MTTWRGGGGGGGYVDPKLAQSESESESVIEFRVICISDLLQGAGQDINHRNKWLDGAIHILLYNFQCSLEDAEEEFQVIVTLTSQKYMCTLQQCICTRVTLSVLGASFIQPSIV